MNAKRRERNEDLPDPRDPKAPRLLKDEPNVVFHDPSFSFLMMRKNIPFGIQFEIARDIANRSKQVSEKHRKIVESLPYERHSHVELHSRLFDLETNMSKREVASTAPWKELDLEDEALCKDPLYGGIGNNPDYPNWWAGKVDFRAKLEETGDRLVLEKATLGPSNKIKRRFGSASVIRVKINQKRFYARDSNLVEFFKRPFIIWDYVFRAFFAKESTVFLFKTNEIYREGCIVQLQPTSSSLTLVQFINWMIPLEENGEQKLCKWAARMALGLSSSIPGPRLTEDEFDLIGDRIIDEEDDSSNMTDGCGTSTLPLHKEIFEILGGSYLQEIPTAIQFRFAGAKGMTLLVDEKEPTFSRIRLRQPSQVKIHYPLERLDPSHATIDILRFSKTKTPAKLSEETIKNLHYNGVPSSVFIALLEAQLRAIVESLTLWEGPDAIPRLWKAVESAENVISARKAREATTDSRTRGFGDREEENDDDEGINQDTSSRAWWRDPISGCPSSLAETVMELLDSGFTPLNSRYLRAKLKEVIKFKVTTATSKFNYVLPQSGTAFAVPDPYGVLEPDQIQFKSSRREFLTADGTKTDIILGQVLMTRNPCKVPTDVRKILAVQHPALRNMVDVIVCSVQGYRRLLDFLAGGDYDGDRGMVIWDPDFVEPFINADEKYSKAPARIDQCFSIDKLTVGQFHSQIRAGRMEVTPESELQEYLLGALRDPSAVGEYSRFHENAIYKFGYGHWRTINLAYKFCKLLDSSKSGHQITAAAYQADRKAYSHPIGPGYKRKLDNVQRTDTSNVIPLQRGEGLGEFIIDILVEAAIAMRNKWLQRLEQHFELTPLNCPTDNDLSAPWVSFCQEAAHRKDREDVISDLNVISEYVEKMEILRREKVGKKDFSNRPIVSRQDAMRELSKTFASFPKQRDLKTLMDPIMIARLKASYAYVHAADKPSTSSAFKFPFDCAFRELCAIKAQATGFYKVCSLSMYELKKQ
ncbi:hypothetical protein GYMLUDRAFT_34630 [Collybiopsis luxurians FD-317 M1]|nr:hypothetical protein GYMLUDRAFT_34630 [Collybiopsis luxurians FD-317 M1]